MKHYRYKEYGGKWDSKKGYRHTYRKNTEPTYKKTTPWKNPYKTIRST